MDWTIGEVARRANVPTSTVRYWERVGLLPKPERVHGRRRYQPQILDSISLIQLAQAAGLTIADIRALVSETGDAASPAERWAAVAVPRARELDAKIESLTHARHTLDTLLACSCASLRECSRQLAIASA